MGRMDPRTSARIAPLHSKVPKWRSTLRSHSLVQVGIEVPTLQHPRWRNATVIEVVPSTDGEVTQARAEEDGAGLRVHVQVDEDDIWLPANDDLLCRPNTHNESKPLSKVERRLLAHDDTLPSDSSEVAEEVSRSPRRKKRTMVKKKGKTSTKDRKWWKWTEMKMKRWV